jgi:hypothetical protein
MKNGDRILPQTEKPSLTGGLLRTPVKTSGSFGKKSLVRMSTADLTFAEGLDTSESKVGHVPASRSLAGRLSRGAGDQEVESNVEA